MFMLVLSARLIIVLSSGLSPNKSIPELLYVVLLVLCVAVLCAVVLIPGVAHHLFVRGSCQVLVLY